MEDRSQSTTVETHSEMLTKKPLTLQSTYVKRSRNNPIMDNKVEPMPELDLTAFEGYLDKMNTAAEMIRSQLLRSQDQLGREMAAIRKENASQHGRLRDLASENQNLQWRLKEAEDKLARSAVQNKTVPAPVTNVDSPATVFGEQITRALTDVIAERARQDAKWGPQNHPHGIRPNWNTSDDERKAKLDFQYGQETDTLNWRLILQEEVSELFNADNVGDIRAEAIQVAAVALAMCESLDRNGK